MSLRLRLLLGLGVVALVIVAVGANVIASIRADLLDRVDDQLRIVSRQGPEGGGLAVSQRGGPGDPDSSANDEAGPVTLWLGVTDGDQVQAVQAPRSSDGEPIGPELTEADVHRLVTEPGYPFTVEGDGSERFRVLSRGGPEGVTWVVGAPLGDVDESVQRLIVVEVVGIVVALTVLGLVAFWVLRLGVRPLKRMATAASEIAAGDLDQRVPDAEPGTEAGDLADALNAMLGRLEEAFAVQTASEARLRRFVADASHELRTPITTIRGYAELHRQGALEDPEARRSAMARTEQEAIRMGSLVDDLLLLARLDQGRPLARDQVDLAALARDASTDAAAAHPDHPVHVEIEGDGTVVGDEDRLRQVVANLVGNAVTHTSPGTEVAISVRGTGSEVVLEVVDDGPGIAPEVAARAFERFSRGDTSRSRASGSTGLGLSIVEAIVSAHGGAVTLDSTPGEGTTVTVTLPRAGA